MTFLKTAVTPTFPHTYSVIGKLSNSMLTGVIFNRIFIVSFSVPHAVDYF